MASNSDHPYTMLITGCYGSAKTNALLNLINHEPDNDKIYLYVKGPYEPKYELLINKRGSTWLKYLMIQKLPFSTQMIWMMFIKILKNTTQVKKEKC